MKFNPRLSMYILPCILSLLHESRLAVLPLLCSWATSFWTWPVKSPRAEVLKIKEPSFRWYSPRYILAKFSFSFFTCFLEQAGKDNVENQTKLYITNHWCSLRISYGKNKKFGTFPASKLARFQGWKVLFNYIFMCEHRCKKICSSKTSSFKFLKWPF